MKDVSQEFRKLKALNKDSKGGTDWSENPVVVLAPFSWLDDLSGSLPFASRQRILGETKANMGIVKVSGSENNWAICHLDTGTIVKQMKSEDIEAVKAEAERYGGIFEELQDSTLTLKNVQDVIKQSLTLDELKLEKPEKFQQELN